MTVQAADRGDAPTDDHSTPPTWEHGGTWQTWERGRMPTAVARGLEQALNRFHAGDQTAAATPADPSPGTAPDPSPEAAPDAAPGEDAATTRRGHETNDGSDTPSLSDSRTQAGEVQPR